MGLAEAAELLELSKASVCDRRRRKYAPGDRLPPFPTPAAKLQCGPIWRRAQIETYAAEVERLAGLSWFERKYPGLDLADFLPGLPAAPGPPVQREDRERLAHAALIEQVLHGVSSPPEEVDAGLDEEGEDA